jgi:hypothetical protein
MLNRIEELRRRSAAHRRKVAVLTSSGIMAVILGIWTVTFPTRFPELVHSTEAKTADALNDQTAAAANTVSPLQALREGFTNSYQGFEKIVTTASTTNTSDTVSGSVIITDPNTDTSKDLQIVE